MKISEIFYISWTKNLIVPESLKTLQIGQIVIYYTLYNNLFYTQLASVFEWFLLGSWWYWFFFSFSSSVEFWYLSQAFFGIL